MARANWEFALVCGSRYVNLMSEPSTGGWTLAEEGGSVIMGKLNAEYTAYDTSYGGGSYSQTTRDNMTVTLSVRILEAGTAALARNIHDVYMFLTDVFLHREGKGPTPVYLVRRTDEGYSGTGKDVVLFGRGPLYHEVQSLDALNIASNAYSIYLLSGTIREASISLTCNAYGTGKSTFLAESTGYIRYDDDGSLAIYSSASNNCPNPSFENTTDFDAGWTTQDADISASLEYERIRTGVQAARVSNTGTSAGYYRITTAGWAASGDRWFSNYVYTDGDSATGSDLSLYYMGASMTTTYSADSDHPGWTRISGSFTSTASGTRTEGIWLAGGKTVIIDDVMTYSSPSSLIPYFDGNSGPGCVWQGTSGSSSASMSSGQCRVRTKWAEQAGYETLFYGKGAISVWVKVPWTPYSGQASHTILASNVTATRNDIQLFTNGFFLYFRMYGSTTAGYRDLSYGITTALSANTWHHICASWDATGPLELWFDGVLQDNVCTTSGTWTNLSAFGTYVYIGSNSSGAQQWDGQISDLRIFGPNATVSPATLYTAGRGKSELASLWTSSIGGTVKNLDDTDQDNHFYITGITGDGKAPLRLFLRPYATAFDRAYLSIFPKDSCSDPAFNTIEIDGIGKTGGSTITDTTVSGSSYVRTIQGTSAALAPSASGSNDSASANITTLTSRTVSLLNKRYRAYGIMRDNASATGIHKVRMGMGTSISQTRAGLGNWQTPPIISSSLSGSAWWTLVDLGIFYPYYTPPVYSFYGQDSTISTCNVGDVDAFIYVWLTSGASGPTFDTDFIAFMPADNCGYVDVASYTMVATDTVLIDTITQPHHTSAISSAGSTLSYAQYASLNWFGSWPYAVPNKWNYCNMLVTNSNKFQHASQVIISGIYQARYLWIR